MPHNATVEAADYHRNIAHRFALQKGYLIITKFRRCMMAKSASVSLGDRFADLMDSKAQSGRHASASDVARAGLRLLKKHGTNAKALQDGFD